MNYLDKIKLLSEPVQLAIREGRSMSYSRASVWQLCSLKGDFQYVKKLPQPESDALKWGSAFDEISEDEFIVADILSRSFSTPELRTVADRAVEYINALDPALTRVTQFPVYAELANGYWFFGFMDDLFYDADGKLVSIEDRKFSAKPWNDNKVKYNHKQAQCYMWALRRMGIEIPREFTFRVANMQQPGIQTFTYKPMMKTVEKVFGWLNEAVLLQESVVRPEGGHHCSWCAFKTQCENLLWPQGG